MSSRLRSHERIAPIAPRLVARGTVITLVRVSALRTSRARRARAPNDASLASMHLVGDVREELGSTGADDRPARPVAVGVVGEPPRQRVCPGRLLRLDVGDDHLQLAARSGWKWIEHQSPSLGTAAFAVACMASAWSVARPAMSVICTRNSSRSRRRRSRSNAAARWPASLRCRSVMSTAQPIVPVKLPSLVGRDLAAAVEPVHRCHPATGLDARSGTCRARRSTPAPWPGWLDLVGMQRRQPRLVGRPERSGLQTRQRLHRLVPVHDARGSIPAPGPGPARGEDRVQFRPQWCDLFDHRPAPSPCGTPGGAASALIGEEIQRLSLAGLPCRCGAAPRAGGQDACPRTVRGRSRSERCREAH